MDNKSYKWAYPQHLAVHLPAHNVGSLADQLTLKPLEEVKEKVGKLVHDTFLTSKSFLKAWVQKELIPKHIAEGIIIEAPSVPNRAHYPTNDDIRVISRNAITEERNAKFDQDAVLSLLILRRRQLAWTTTSDSIKTMRGMFIIMSRIKSSLLHVCINLTLITGAPSTCRLQGLANTLTNMALQTR